ncbi:MAG: TlpA family protein disulfide reductase [Caldilineaceae bacterium]|nr:TlpA family protein disulfide reductase [Caldilineaceae bacterium]
MNRWTIAFFSILIFGSGWLWYSRLPANAPPAVRTPQPAVDHPAPDFSLTRFDTGEPVKLSDLQGKPVILNFWATWCRPCRAEMPALQATYERYGDDLLVVGVDQGEETGVVGPFLEEFGITFPILLDGDTAVGRQYRILGLPTTFFIDSQGIIRRVHAGEINSAILAESIIEIAR